MPINTNDGSLNRLNDVLQKSQSGTIVLPQNPAADAVAAATALYLSLNKAGKAVSIACSSKVAFNLTGADKIQSQLTTSGDNLVISFPYSEGSIDKVDYNIKGENFNLIIAPRQGYPKLDPKQVKYTYTGGSLDFVIVIDSPTLNSIGALYTENEKQFQGKEIINIDRHLTNSFYGTINYINKTSSSLSELIFKLLQNLGIELDREIATNLYAGISSATNNFTSYSVTADTFDAIAKLMRAGAIKKTIQKANQPMRGFPSQSINRPFNPPSMNNSFRGGFSEEPDVITPIEDVEKKPRGIPQAPQDWLKPKIFKGGSGGLI